MGMVSGLAIVASVVSVQLLIILLLWKFVRGLMVRVIRDGIVAARDYDGAPVRNVPKGLSHNPDRDGRNSRNGVKVLSADEVRALKARRAARINREGK